MAYPSGIDNGYCPSSHPVHLISIFYELWFSVAPFNALNDGGKFVLSTGDPNGYSLHGDFFNGWDNDVLSRAVQTCTDDSGVIENCGVFENENRFVSNAEMNSCAAVNPLPSEDVGDLSPIPYLPGCVAITNGPGPASAADLDPNCVAASGGSSSIISSSSSTSLAGSQTSSMAASGVDSVPTITISSSQTSATPASGDASGDDSGDDSSDFSVPSTNISSVLASSVPASGYDSVPSITISSVSPSTTPASGDDSGDSGDDSSNGSVPSITLSTLLPSNVDVNADPTSLLPTPSTVLDNGSVPSVCPPQSSMLPSDLNSILSSFLSSVLPTQLPSDVPASAAYNSILSSFLSGVLPTQLPSDVNVNASPTATPLNITVSFDLPSSANNDAVYPTGNPSVTLSSSFSPTPSGAASSGAASVTMYTVQPSGYGQQDDESDGDGDEDNCSSEATPTQGTRRRHHVRRERQGSYMRF